MATKTDKPFSCPECDYTAKTQGAITQHVNKAHADDPGIAIRANFGDLAPRPGGLGTVQAKLEAMPSGIPSIDHAIGIGGVPKGRIIEVFGPPHAGKTFVALTFSAQSQQRGGVAGFMDAERALQETFVKLVPGLNANALHYGQAHGGEEAFEMSRQFIKTGGYEVWTIDSLKACMPAALADKEIGSPATRAALASLLSDALPVMDTVCSDAGTTLVMVNHQKEIPGVTHGRNWYTPGGSAPEYHCAVRMRVWSGATYYRKEDDQRFGHRVKVKIEKNKVAMPFSTAEFDLYYGDGTRKASTSGTTRWSEKECTSGVDVASSWLDVVVSENLAAKSSSGHYVSLPDGERIGTEAEILEMLDDPKSDLRQKAQEAVYPKQFTNG